MRDALVSPLLDAALRGAVVLIAALVLTTLLHRRSAALRHAIWAGAIVAQLVVLALAVWGPRWRIAAPEIVSALIPVRAEVATVTPAGHEAAPPSTRGPVPGDSVTYLPASSDTLAAPRAVRTESSAPVRAPEPTRGAPSRTTVLLALWALGVAVVLLRLAAGTVIVSRLARRGRRVDDGGWLSLATRLATTLRIDRPLTLLRGDRLGVPVTWGIVYPIVLLPDDADAWPEERRRYVLVHEMAHVKRLDALTQLVGQVALALFWFDPLMWIAVRRMQLEREHACDDYVLRHGTQPSRYAADLLEMVQSLGTPAHRAAQPAFAALAMARRTEFEGRMLSILDPVLDRHPLHRGRTLMGALASLLIIVPLAALQPYRPAPASAQATSAPAPVSTSSSVARSSDGARPSAAADAPRTRRLQSLDSARTSVAVPHRATDSSYARVIGPGGVATSSVAASHSASSNGSQANSTSNSSSAEDNDSCDDFRSGSSKRSQFHMHADDDGAGSTIRYLEYDQNRCRQAAINGKLVTAENEDHIVTMTPPGSSRAYFRERTADVDRELTWTSARSGDPTTGAILYRVNGVERPYDDEGRRWFAAFLPRVLAEASVNVNKRVAYWRSQGGVDNALRHIAELRSSGAKRAHYIALLDGPLSGAELDRVMKQAGRDIPSSGDLRVVLSKAAAQTRTVKVQASTLEEAAGAVPSSGDLSRFLVDVAPRYLGHNDAMAREWYFAAAAKIPSSGDLSRVLVNAVPYATKSPDIARAVITTAGAVPASADRARVLVALATSGAVKGAALRDAYLKAASEIPSSGDMRRALEAIARTDN